MYKTAYLLNSPNDHIVSINGIPFAAIVATNMPQPYTVENHDGDWWLIENVEKPEPAPPHQLAYFIPNTDIIVLSENVEYRPNERPR